MTRPPPFAISCTGAAPAKVTDKFVPLSLLLAASLLLLLPLVTGLARTPPGELAAAFAGFFGGALLRFQLAGRRFGSLSALPQK